MITIDIILDSHKFYINILCTHISLLSIIYPLPAMHSLLVTLSVTKYIEM